MIDYVQTNLFINIANTQLLMFIVYILVKTRR